MRASRGAWYAGLPLLAVSWLSAHGLAYELVPAGESAETAAHGPAHGYLTHLPLAVSALFALATVAIVRRVAAGERAWTGASWVFALLPVAAFAVQEHLERVVQGPEAVLATAAEPVFVVGILLQVPFSLFAAWLTRGALAMVGALSAARSPRRLRQPPPCLTAPAAVLLFPLPVLATRRAGRAPPFLFSS